MTLDIFKEMTMLTRFGDRPYVANQTIMETTTPTSPTLSIIR